MMSESLSAQQRYDYLMDAMVREEAVWILSSNEGMVMMSSDGEQCLPIWPDAGCASEWATGEWSDCEPESVDLRSWMERWLPGMAKDGLALALYPVMDADTIVEDPGAMEEELAERLDS